LFDQEIVKFLAQLGVGGAIAGLLFFFYRKDMRSYTELWKTQADINSRMTDSMIVLVRENTAAFTENTSVLKSLHRRMDRLDILRVVSDDEVRPAADERRRDPR
jgi:hypothetical protein